MAVAEQIKRVWLAGLSFSGAKWLLLGTVIGLASGCLGFLFVVLVDFGSDWVLSGLVGYESGDPEPGHVRHLPSTEYFNGWMLLLVLLAGGFLSAWMRLRWAGDNALQGTNLAVDAFHNNRGVIEERHWIVRFLTTVITLVSGGSAGREGPVAMVGAGCGSWFGKRLHLSRRDRRILLVAGMAAGIAAVFRAPLAGTLFAAEVLYAESDLEADALIPGFIAAVTAFCCFGLLDALLHSSGGGDMTVALFQINSAVGFTSHDMAQLLGYTLIAICVCALMWLMRRVYQLTERAFIALPLPEITKPALGAVLTGVCGIALFYGMYAYCAGIDAQHMPLAVLGAGYGIVQDAFDGARDGFSSEATFVVILLCVAFGKIVTSSLTIGSGGSGGLFGPSMVIGACLGAALGIMFRWLDLPWLTPPLTACLVMGMASALTANFRTPLAALLMVSELTGGYQLLLPAMWVCSLSFLLSGRQSLVQTQVPTQLHSSAHRGHFFSDVLTGIRVGSVFNPERDIRTLNPQSSLDQCKRLVTDTHQNIYPVVDDSNHLSGIFSMNDLRSFLYDESLGLVVVAQDIATDHMIVLQPRDSLATAMRRFTELNIDELPVVNNEEEMQFLGLLSRRELITHYNKVVEELRAQRKAEGYDDVSSETGRDKR